MKKGIAVSLICALLMSVMLLAPLHSSEAAGWLEAVSGPTPTPSDDVLTDSFNALYALNSAHMDMDITLDLTVIIGYGGQQMTMPMSIVMKADMDEQMQPFCYRLQMSMDLNAMGNAQTLQAMTYTVQEDGVFTVYSSSDGGKSWHVNTAEAPKFDPADMAAMLLKYFKGFTAAGTELVDGKETVVYSGQLNTGFMQEALDTLGASEALSEATEGTGLESLSDLGEMGDIDVTVYIDTETQLPIKYTMDMTNMLKELMGTILKVAMGMGDMEGYEIDVEINTALAVCRMSDFNAVPPITVPEDIKAVGEVAVTP